jgi:predicted negative regulator of RcsB-dependent stress response
MAKKTEEPAAPGVNPTPVYIGGESLADKIVPHVKKILVMLGVVSLVATVFFTYRWWAHRKAEKATAALVTALDHASWEIEPPPTEPDPTPPDPEAEPPRTYPTHQARAESALGKLRQVSGDQRSGAALLEADLLYEAGQLDQAEAIYRKLSGRGGVEGVVAREGVGFVAEAKGDLDTALEAFRAAQPDEAGPRREYALYHEGRILAQQGKKDEARAAFEKALEKAKEVASDLEATIEVRLTQLDLPPVAPKAPEAPKEPTP